jgi:bifunctional non-homologous end joining protein LigD
MIHRMDPPADPDRAAPPARIAPMQATLARRAPTGDGWAWELKWDGIRAIAYVEGGRVKLETRTGNDVTHRYPELRKLGEALGTREVILDGEVVAFDDRGRPSFELLQRRMHVEGDSTIRRLVGQVPVTYILFDVLWHEGHSTLELPYEERRALLASLELNGPSWQAPPHEVGDGATTTEVSKQFELEGVVAKRLDSPYEPGRRSRAWLKIKNSLRQEFVVGGWQEGEGGRSGSIGSLLIGYYDDDSALHYAGKVGSGLSGASIAELTRLFERCARDTTPFATGKPPKGVHFVEPVLVVEVRFTEWTSTGNVRQPTFLGTRTDKEPADVRREIPE